MAVPWLCSAGTGVRRMMLVLLVILPLPRPAPAHQASDGSPPPKDYAEDYHSSLRGDTRERLSIYGPDATTCVRFAADGLHITLPAGYPRQRPGTGIVTDFGIRGDFDITMSFDILGEPAEASGNPTDLRLMVVPNEVPEPDAWHRSNKNRASVSRLLGADGGQFIAEAFKWNAELPRDKWGNEQFDKLEPHSVQQVPAQSSSGRLRLVRSGPTLSFYASDGADQAFRPLHQDEFGTKDLKNVRVLASTGWTNRALEVRVTDLRIRADALVSAVATTAEPVAAPAVPGRGRRRLVLALVVPGLGVALAVGAWWYWRRALPYAEKRP